MAVAAVQPDRLAKSLLDTPFAARDVPDGTSASAPRLSDLTTGVTQRGLVTTVYTAFSGPANDIWVNYYVFDNPGDATAYYTASIPAMRGYRAAGQLTGAGIGDPTKCQTARSAAQPQWGWGCLMLSSNVVSYSATTSNSDTNNTGARFDLVLARDAIRSCAVWRAQQPGVRFPSPQDRYSPTPCSFSCSLRSPRPWCLPG